MTDAQLMDVHQRQHLGYRLSCIAAELGLPSGTLRRRLHEFRRIHNLKSPYQIRMEVLARAIRHRDTPEDVSLFLARSYGIQVATHSLRVALNRHQRA